MNATLPIVTVIIPAFNAENTIEHCLKALENQTYPSTNCEVIVVDDSSSDKTRDKIKSAKNVILLSQKKSGPAVARNIGAENAKGELLLFTDADCVPKNDWIEKMVFPFSQPDIVDLTHQESLVARFVQMEYEGKYEKMNQYEYIDFIDTYSAAYRKDIFISNGGFDPVFKTSSVEDQEFSFRLAKQGLKMVFEEEAIVYHMGHAETLLSYFRKKFKIGYWKVWVHQLHPEKIMADTHTPQVVKLQIILAGIGTLLLLLGITEPKLLVFACLAGIMFIISTLQFINNSRTVDIQVAAISPIMLLIRAFGLGLGLITGIISYSIRRVKNNISSHL